MTAMTAMTGHPTRPDPTDRARRTAAPEPLGLRIARRRTARGWTQAELAARVAISRVALSNLESGRSTPGERTVTLLAGTFGIEPIDLVDGTDYPAAKVERLPPVTTRYTEAELQLALLDRDLRWIEGAPPAVAERVLTTWHRDLSELERTLADPGQRRLVREGLRRLDRS
jgi:transcriptional regulator with XRE-family HTH domain